MKKLNLFFSLTLGTAFLFGITSCNNDVDQTKNAMAVIAARNTGVTKVTFNTSHGTNVARFDNAKKKIVSSDSIDRQTGIVTSRSYSYDGDNNIRMLSIKKGYSPEVIYYYGTKDSNSRSLASSISDDIVATPVKIRSVTKTTEATSRALAKEESAVTEYYGDESGNIVAVIQRDSYGNIKMKSAVGDEQ